MRISVEKRYAQAFNAVLAEEQISNPAVFMNVNYYDEVPVYSRFYQLEFLSSLSFTDANRILIKASALYLERINSFAAQHRHPEKNSILRMISITDWLDEDEAGRANYDGSAAYLTPNICLLNVEHPRLARFPVWPVTSPAGFFVRDTLNDDERFNVVEGQPDKFGAPVPERVYIYMPGSEGSERLTITSGTSDSPHPP